LSDISADALQTELTRLLRLAADAHAAHDLTLAKQATDEAAKCLVKLAEAQSALRVQEPQPAIGQQHQAEQDTQAGTDKGDTD
jgi:hypothetical protein